MVRKIANKKRRTRSWKKKRYRYDFYKSFCFLNAIGKKIEYFSDLQNFSIFVSDFFNFKFFLPFFRFHIFSENKSHRFSRFNLRFLNISVLFSYFCKSCFVFEWSPAERRASARHGKCCQTAQAESWRTSVDYKMRHNYYIDMQFAAKQYWETVGIKYIIKNKTYFAGALYFTVFNIRSYLKYDQSNMHGT